jgi:hypothetical protein
MIQAYALVTIRHERAYDFDERRGVWLRRLESEDRVHNILTDAGRVAIHTYVYGTASQRISGGLSGTGFNFIALSSDLGIPAAGDTVLTGELSGNGLDRVQGIVALPTGAGVITTVSNLFTYVGVPTQVVYKTALFDAISGGKMTHEIAFPVKTLNTDDTLAISFDITLT